MKEKWRINEGLSSRGKELSARVWNEGSGSNLSRGMATEAYTFGGKENEVRAKGKFPTVLVLTLSALKPIFAPACEG
jgi:hypothetical protein